VLVAVITPLSQYLTLRTVNADIETAAPVAWAVGLIISLVLVLLPIRLIAGIKRIPRPHLVVLYAMLTVAVPVMNLGLVRQVFMAMFAVPSVFMIDGNNTYRTVYAASDPDWFPVVPTRQGLAWNQSKRLLELLEDRPAIDARAAARQQLLGLVAQQTHRLVAEDATPDPDVRRRLIDRLGQLGAAELESAFATIKGDDDALRVLATYELIDEPSQAPSGDYAAAIDAAQRRSEAAAEALIEQLPDTSELAVSLLAISDDSAAEGFVTDVHDPRLSKSAKAWIEEDLITLPTDWRRRVEAQRDALLKPQNDGRPLWKHLRERVTALTPSDRAKVGRALIEHREQAVSKLDDQQFMQGREPGEPNQNLAAFIDGIGYTPDRKAELAQRPITDRLEAAHAQVPWNIWRAPMLHWGAVFLLIFLMLMALAELLRRKWVERENLAFPLVEVVPPGRGRRLHPPSRRGAGDGRGPARPAPPAHAAEPALGRRHRAGVSLPLAGRDVALRLHRAGHGGDLRRLRRAADHRPAAEDEQGLLRALADRARPRLPHEPEPELLHLVAVLHLHAEHRADRVRLRPGHQRQPLHRLGRRPAVPVPHGATDRRDGVFHRHPDVEAGTRSPWSN